MGVDMDGNGIGEPVDVWKKPNTGKTDQQGLALSDEFSDSRLGVQWQWCHNPVDEAWSLREKRGWLTLKALPADQLRHSRNMLTQKTVGFEGEAVTLLTRQGRARAGLLCMGKQFRALGIGPEGVYTEVDGETTVIKSGTFKRLYARVKMDARQNHYQFYYSTDGRRFEEAGPAFEMRNGYWKGVRVGLYCYGDDGQAQFDWFRYEVK
jgi:beta-xylosidase